MMENGVSITITVAGRSYVQPFIIHHSSFSDKVHVRVVTEVSKCQVARRPLSYDHLVQREEQSRTLDADWREVSSLDVKTTF
jgi:hypothetical protein